MIKLIAADMDGTLLDDNKQLPPDFGEVFPKIAAKGIHFVIASGRSFFTLKDQFAELTPKMTFICDNGAYVWDRGEIEFVSIIAPENLKRLVRACEKIPGAKFLICGLNNAYHYDYGEEYNREASKFYSSHKVIADLDEIDDQIFKIALFNENAAESVSLPALQRTFDDEFSFQMSGKSWIDIMNSGISKGEALKALQRKHGISYEQTMVFGDFYNDCEMLQSAYYSFAMGNAHPRIKKAANFITKSNNDYGVTYEIRNLVLREA